MNMPKTCNFSFLENYLQKKERNSAVIAYLAAIDHLSESHPEIAKNILKELQDQRSFLKLIASENFSSLTTQLAMGNLLTDKYCEGFPHHRFYAGCDNVDAIEDLTIQLAKNLFGADHAYVQPHSGADANLVAFWAILITRIQNREIERLGKKNLDELSSQEHETIRQLLCSQKILGLSLSSGGHLTHGYRHNVSAKMMQAFNYDVDDQTGLLDYEQIRQIAKREKPLILLAGYSAYPRKINFAKMREIADEIDAVFMVDMAHFAGLVAGKVFTGDFDPVPFAHIVTSTTHKTLRGPRGGLILCKQEYAEAVNKGCPAVLGGPLPHVIAAKAVAFKEASTPEFCTYSQQIVTNARMLAETLKQEGLKIVTDGTDNHLLLIDLSSLNITGRQAETCLREAGVTVNRNMIRMDKNGPWYTSAVRIGTPALTTLGMGVQEMQQVGKIIAKVLKNCKPALISNSDQLSKAKANVDSKVLEEVQREVHDLLKRFPLYPELIFN